MIIAYSIFSSVELCVIAIAVAAAFVGFLLRPPRHGPSCSYAYPLFITPSDEQDISDESELEACAEADGSVTISRHNVPLPAGAVGHATVEVAGDKVTIVEKYTRLPRGIPREPHDVAVRLKCLKPKRYHIRYETPARGLWGLITIVNTPGCEAGTKLGY